MPNDARVRALLGDLGRATLRGVRKCPKCGTYNGTRGSSCKNRACDVVFNHRGMTDKQSKPIDACKLITGSSNQLYSVRVRDKGPDVRGFVYVPQNLDSASSLDSSSDALSLLTSQGQCFVENCQRHFEDKNSFPSLLLPCSHIQAAVRCYAQAQPLLIKNEILQTLNISQEIKQAIWLLQSETEGPLVQRVSKNMMVVRCKRSPKCPLGYVHLSIFSTKIKDRVEHKYCCACKAYDNMTSKVPGKNPNERQCLHYYACVSAFASDVKLSEEFSMYVSLLVPQMVPMKDALDASKLLVNQLPIDQIVAVVTKQTADGSQELSFQVLGDHSILGTASLSLNEDGQITEVHALDANLDDIQMKIGEQDESLSFPSLDSHLLDRTMSLVDMGKKVDQLDPSVTANSFLLSDVASARTHPPDMQMLPSAKRKAAGKKVQLSPPKKINPSPEPVDESRAFHPFLDWLASVTERINETMHYETSGRPDPLVFHVPQLFFDCLKERICNGGKKKRIPNVSTVTSLRSPVPRSGNFIKYTWHITNIIHVKKIFDTSAVALDITRSFVENKDGTFDHFVSLLEEEKYLYSSSNMPLIRPLELKTYLKVGLTAPEQKNPTPFVIEWIPDVFPRTKVGEMSLTFEFGHQRFQQHQGQDANKKVNRPPKIICAKRKIS
ncbi:uncharacterized protein C2orf42 homolog [Neocloeon triangulifer]|uniref:uncharacterized protein C2orf42 homolog n=1 Tax=Neocloeon triangulifer TaxID=2078957 RepID=UPI00286ED3E5|nr:uncharacterized protein C2orf42 homolog [Neocloeon triangulifer]